MVVGVAKRRRVQVDIKTVRKRNPNKGSGPGGYVSSQKGEDVGTASCTLQIVGKRLMKGLTTSEVRIVLLSPHVDTSRVNEAPHNIQIPNLPY